MDNEIKFKMLDTKIRTMQALLDGMITDVNRIDYRFLNDAGAEIIDGISICLDNIDTQIRLNQRSFDELKEMYPCN